MIKNKTALISAIVLLIICMFLFFPYPNNPLLGADVTFMSFPLHNGNGFVWKGILGTIVFLIALALLIYALKKFYVVFAILVLFIYALLPGYLVTAYQKTLASGIGAISYDQNGTCSFDTLDEENMKAECKLTLKNHSSQPVSFELVFVDSGLFQKDIQMVSLLNIAGPYIITVEENREEYIHLDEVLDVSDVTDHVYSGSTADVHFKLVEKEKERIF